MFKKWVYFIIFLILFSSNISATYIRPKEYHTHQTLDFVNERVYVSTNNIDVYLKSEFFIDGKIFNKSNNISFMFSPLFDWEFEDVIKLNYYIRGRTSGNKVYTSDIDLNYTVDKNITTSRYEFFINISKLKPWDEIIFLSNFTLENKVEKIRNTEYSLLYISQHNAQHQTITFYFPYDYQIITYPNNGKWSYNGKTQYFRISENYSNEHLYFVFRDLNEEKTIENKNQIINLLLGGFIGFIFSLITGIIFQKKIPNKLINKQNIDKFLKLITIFPCLSERRKK